MSDLSVEIPSFCKPEFTYTISCLLDEFIGLTYQMSVLEDTSHVVIRCNEHSLVIENHFFDLEDRLTYNLPHNVVKGDIDVGGEVFPIVGIYGEPRYTVDQSNHRLAVDIISSTFFMLSRWEEHYCTERDIHGRFPARSSLAKRYDFIDRPIVNEYVELLWAILQQMGIKQERKSRDFALVPTHDVDKPFLFQGWRRSLRYFAGSIKRGRIGELIRYCQYRLRGDDPFDTYDRLMDLAERENSKAHFFFLQKGVSKHDENHDIEHPKVKKLAQRISERGHYIGFHPSYLAVENEQLFRREKEHLEDTFGIEVQSGRHHFLRCEVPTTWRMWHDAGIKWDSTMGYADHAGFRCGVCYPFPVFDIVERKQLDLIERPLIGMEWSFVHYQGLAIDAA